MLITEQLFLLLRSDDGTGESGVSYPAYGLVGALLTDFALAGCVDFEPGAKNPRVDVRPPAQRFAHPVLDAGMEKLVPLSGKKINSIITRTALDPTQQVAEALAGAGILEIVEKRMLGLIPARYPMRNPQPENTLRARLGEVLAGTRTPQAEDAAVLALLAAVAPAHKVLAAESRGMSKKEMAARIDEICRIVEADGTMPDAVRRAVASANAAISAGITAAITASVASSSQ